MRVKSGLMIVVGALIMASPTMVLGGVIGYSVQSNGNDHLYSIDLKTGAATDLGALNFGDAEGLAFAGSNLYAIGGTEEEFWNITTPPGTKIGSTGSRNGLDAGLDSDPISGKMYNINGHWGGRTFMKSTWPRGPRPL